MTCDNLQPLLQSLIQCRPYGEGALIDTTCLYPSGKVVQILVQRRGTSHFLVSDAGGAIDELEASGIEVRDAYRVLRAYSRKYGVKAESGALFETDVSAEDLPSAVRVVANASQESASRELATHKFRPHRHLEEMFAEFMQKRFPDQFSTKLVEGKNRAHLFEYVHERPKQKLLIVDPVLRDASSMNAHIVAHLDVRAADQRKVEQYLVYDDEEEWTSDQLGMLELAAPIVAFRNVEKVLWRSLERV